MSGASTGYLKVSNGSLRVYCSEPRRDEYVLLFFERQMSYGKFPAAPSQSRPWSNARFSVDLPTLELASVRLSLSTSDQNMTSMLGLRIDIPIQSGRFAR